MEHWSDEPDTFADFVTVDLNSPRTAGALPGSPLDYATFAANVVDISNVIVGGRLLVRDGQHVTVENPGQLLENSIASVHYQKNAETDQH